jgi:hypothetical protein
MIAHAVGLIVTVAVVLLILALVGLVHSGFILGIATLAVGAGIIWNVSRRLTASASASAALYLMLVPLAVPRSRIGSTSGSIEPGGPADGISDFSASPDRVNYIVPRPPAHSGRTNGSPSLQG